ncbi:MAG: porin [Cyclobacteriaceae bacterium]|nr:porin [Cyclobacteriaceae bacterium]
MNHVWVGCWYNAPKYRFAIAAQEGTYVEDNYPEEPLGVRNVLEATLGFRLRRDKSIWVDAGVFPSHIGFETAGSKTNWTLSRSVMAENSPYYLSGVKVSWKPNLYWEMVLAACNGWQRIYQNGKLLPALSSQVKFTQEKTIFNWSLFYGKVNTGHLLATRYFSNLYGQFFATNKIGFIIAVDAGLQHERNHYYKWWTAVGTSQYQITPKLRSAARVEYFHDPAGVLTNPLNLITVSGSINIDYQFPSFLLLRIEARQFRNRTLPKGLLPDNTTNLTISLLAEGTLLKE